MAHRSIEHYRSAAVDVIRAMIADQGAVTASEMEARASDRTYDTAVANFGIDPHHLTWARQQLAESEIRSEYVPSRGGRGVSTWTSVEKLRNKAITRVAARKRLLTVRHAGWGQRGGNGRGLLGAAGEGAMVTALSEAPGYANVTHSATTILGVDVSDIGEVDVTCGLYDDSDPFDPVAITIMIEVKNTRHWYYDDRVHDHKGDVRRFLRKAARVQARRPQALICPVLIVRNAQHTMVKAAEEFGFVVASVKNQLVLADHDIARRPDHFDEVRDELGYLDLRLLKAPTATTNYHRGIVAKLIPQRARAAAETWQARHSEFADPHELLPF